MTKIKIALASCLLAGTASARSRPSSTRTPRTVIRPIPLRARGAGYVPVCSGSPQSRPQYPERWSCNGAAGFRQPLPHAGGVG